jgi:hypothetical protein
MTTSAPKKLLYSAQSLQPNAMSIRALILTGVAFGIEIGCAAKSFSSFFSRESLI